MRSIPCTIAGIISQRVSSIGWQLSKAADTQGTGKVLSQHAKAVIQQIKQAGYTVGKAPKIKALTADDLDGMMKELGVE